MGKWLSGGTDTNDIFARWRSEFLDREHFRRPLPNIDGMALVKTLPE